MEKNEKNINDEKTTIIRMRKNLGIGTYFIICVLSLSMALSFLFESNIAIAITLVTGFIYVLIMWFF